MSSTSSPTLICDVRARRADRRLAVLALAASVLGPSLVTSVGALTVFLLSAISAVAVFAGLSLAGWIGPRRLTTVIWSRDGQWLLTDRRGITTPARLGAGSRVGSQWVWLRWEADQSRWWRVSRSLLIAAGDIPADDLRRLVVRLRIDSPLRDTVRNLPATQMSPT